MIAYRMNSVAPNPTVQRDSFPALILNCSTVRTIVSNVECEQRGSRITPSHAGSDEEARAIVASRRRPRHSKDSEDRTSPV